MFKSSIFQLIFETIFLQHAVILNFVFSLLQCQTILHQTFFLTALPSLSVTSRDDQIYL